jgi:hypothetical protein
MGFDTTLEIGGRVLLMWRKHASPTPRILFRFDDLCVLASDDPDDVPAVEVLFLTSVKGALANLEEAGLGWGAAVAAYADTRIVGGAASGFELSRLTRKRRAERDLEQTALRGDHPRAARGGRRCASAARVPGRDDGGASRRHARQARDRLRNVSHRHPRGEDAGVRATDLLRHRSQLVLGVVTGVGACALRACRPPVKAAAPE